jgi:hypothetical protein
MLRSSRPTRARLLGITTRDLLRLIYEHRIRYVMVDGIARVPADAIDEYRPVRRRGVRYPRPVIAAGYVRYPLIHG